MALMAIDGGGTHGQERPGPGRPTVRRVERGPRLAALICAGLFSVGLSEIYARGRGPARSALARQAVAYLAHVVLSMTYEEVGRAMSRDRTTIAHACRRVEDLRDEPAFDRMIGAAEVELARMVAARGHLRLCRAEEARS